MRLTTGPLQLRMVTPRAAHQLLQLARDPQVSRFLQWQPHVRIEDSLAYIDDTRSLWQRRVAFLPGIFELEHERLVGAIGISHIDRANHRCEVGTWIGVPFQRRGYNLFAKAAIFAMAFELLAMRRIELLVRVDNAPSLRSMSKLPGVEHEGVQRQRIVGDGASHDAHMFAITTASYDRAVYPEVEIVGALG